MTKDPKSFELTEWQAAMLANIFRNILREILRDEDKEKLAPGELGINYKTGTLYVRNPHTGELFSPNSMEAVKLILSKFDTTTNSLNADRVGDVTVYSRLTQLDKLTVDFTPDSVIRQMTSPSLFLGPVCYENYRSLGWPSPNGMCMAFKANEACAVIRFYDNRTFSMYHGKYNYIRHAFEGWGIGGNEDCFFSESYTAGDILSVHFDSNYKDLDVVAVRLNESVYPNAQVTVNGKGPLPIVKLNRKPLDTELQPNTTIMLIYDEQNREWVYFDPTDSAVYITMTITTRRLLELRSYTEKIVDDLDKTLHKDLQQTADRLIERHDADMQTMSEKHKSDLEAAQVRHDADIQEVVRMHAVDIQQLTNRHNADIEAQQQLLEESVEQITEQHNSDMAAQTDALIAAKTQHEEDINTLRDEFNSALSNLADKHSDDIQAQSDALQSAINKHEADMENQGQSLVQLAEKHRRDLEALTTAFNNQLADLRQEATIALNKAVVELKKKIHELSIAPGNIHNVISVCRIGSSDVTQIPTIEGFDSRYDKLVVNYGQTILREGLDYTVVGDGIKFADSLVFVNGDTIQFTVFKQTPLD